MKQFFQQHKLRIGIIAVLFVVFAAIGFNVFYSELRKRSKAAPTGTPVLYLTPAGSPPMNSDRGLKVEVKLDPNGYAQPLYAFDVRVKFNPTKFEFYNSTLNDSLMISSDILTQTAELVGADTVHIIGTKMTNPFTDTNQLIASIYFKMKSGQDFPVEFTWGDVTIETSNFVRVPLSLATNSTSSSSSSTSQNADEVKLYFATQLEKYHVGDTVNLDVFVSSGNKQFGSVGAGVVFDPALLEYKSAAVDTNLFNQTSIVVPPPAGGTFISVNAARTTQTSGAMKVATVTFTAKAAGIANFAFTQDKSAVYTLNATPQNLLTKVEPYSISISALSSSSSSSVSGGGIPAGTVEESTGTILHINSNASYQSPFRYSQTVSLQSTDYTLSGLAKVYVARGRGVVLIVTCGEADCNNGKKQGDIITRLPFAQSTNFVRQETNFTITNGPKKYTITIYVEDGSEADFDYISLKNVWDGELMENPHFEKKTSKSYKRLYPADWTADDTGKLYGGIYNQWDPAAAGMLYINSSVRK